MAKENCLCKRRSTKKRVQFCHCFILWAFDLPLSIFFLGAFLCSGKKTMIPSAVWHNNKKELELISLLALLGVSFELLFECWGGSNWMAVGKGPFALKWNLFVFVFFSTPSSWEIRRLNLYFVFLFFVLFFVHFFYFSVIHTLLSSLIVEKGVNNRRNPFSHFSATLIDFLQFRNVYSLFSTM